MHEGLIAFSSIDGVGRVAIYRVVSKVGFGLSLEEYLEAYVQMYPARKNQVARLDPEPTKSFASTTIATLVSQGGWLVTWQDVDYPKQLKARKNSPPFLYGRGHRTTLGLGTERRLVVVGENTPSSMSKQMVDLFLLEANQGHSLSCLTGLSDETSIYATELCLEHDIPVVLFSASGTDVLQSEKQQSLYDDILDTNAVVSEYPPGTGVQAYRIVERDKLLVQSADIVFLVSGPMKGRVKRLVDLAMSERKSIVYPESMVDWSEAVLHVHERGQGVPLSTWVSKSAKNST